MTWTCFETFVNPRTYAFRRNEFHRVIIDLVRNFFLQALKWLEDFIIFNEMNQDSVIKIIDFWKAVRFEMKILVPAIWLVSTLEWNLLFSLSANRFILCSVFSISFLNSLKYTDGNLIFECVKSSSTSVLGKVINNW